MSDERGNLWAWIPVMDGERPSEAELLAMLHDTAAAQGVTAFTIVASSEDTEPVVDAEGRTIFSTPPGWAVLRYELIPA